MDASYFHPLCASAAHSDRARLRAERQLAESDDGGTLRFSFSSTQYAKPAINVTVPSNHQNKAQWLSFLVSEASIMNI
jgi:hypothetical protein